LVLKPINDNLSDLSSQFYIKIIDFGASNYYEKDQPLKLKIGSPYYIAPEVIQKQGYDEKCDIWSSGVLLYILLSGIPPFKGKNPLEIMNNVVLGKYSLKYDLFPGVSEDALDLISKMLTYNYEDRISADEVYDSPWLQKFRTKKIDSLSSNISKNDEFSKVVNNIMKFNAEDKLQQAALAYMVHVHEYTEETNKLKQLFFILDKAGNGRLTYMDLKTGFEKILGKLISKEEFRKVIEDIDMDQNGFIEYNEFLCSSLNKRKLLSEKNLQIAFANFDQDKKGFITEGEIKNIIGTTEDLYFDELNQKIKLEHEGLLSFNEFKDLMLLILVKENK